MILAADTTYDTWTFEAGSELRCNGFKAIATVEFSLTVAATVTIGTGKIETPKYTQSAGTVTTTIGGVQAGYAVISGTAQFVPGPGGYFQIDGPTGTSITGTTGVTFGVAVAWSFIQSGPLSAFNCIYKNTSKIFCNATISQLIRATGSSTSITIEFGAGLIISVTLPVSARFSFIFKAFCWVTIEGTGTLGCYPYDGMSFEDGAHLTTNVALLSQVGGVYATAIGTITAMPVVDGIGSFYSDNTIIYLGVSGIDVRCLLTNNAGHWVLTNGTRCKRIAMSGTTDCIISHTGILVAESISMISGGELIIVAKGMRKRDGSKWEQCDVKGKVKLNLQGKAYTLASPTGPMVRLDEARGELLCN